MRNFLAGVAAVGFCLIVNIPTVYADENTQPDREDIQRFSNAYHMVKQYYVDDVKDNKLFKDAISGMLSGLDPHSNFLDEADLKDLHDMTTGEFGGLGLEVTQDQGYIKVITPIDDTPAQKAGFKPGDLIIKVDNVPVKSMSITEAVNKMRGPKGSKVTLTVYRKSTDKLFKTTLVREIIHVKSVKGKLLDDKYGYIRIASFQEQTSSELLKTIADLNKQAGGQMKGLIIDLRNNPGGLLESAVDVSNDLLPKASGKEGLIVYTKGRIPGSKFEAYATHGDATNGIPIVVLINQGSASGAEIVAGALQDHKRAILVGEDSFGKGSVQTVLPLDQKTAIKLTTALYYTPSGRSIQAEGIKPDVVVKDLRIATDDKDNNLEILGRLKEADLEGHLANGNEKPKDDKNKPVAPTSKLNNIGDKSEDLASTDYQLFESLQILKALAIKNQIK